MRLIVDAHHRGTPETSWLSTHRLLGAPVLDPLDLLPAPSRVVVISPHPDDEVLALGGTMLRLARAGHFLEIVAVTDGEASHPRSSTTTREQMRELRATERTEALRRLGLPCAVSRRLKKPDGGVARSRDLETNLVPLLRGASFCFAPWECDGHPDHDAVGRAAARATDLLGITLLRYPVWAWHWAEPTSCALPWSCLHRLPLDDESRRAKAQAIAAFESQIHPLGPEEGDAPILPSHILSRFQRPFETAFTPAP